MCCLYASWLKLRVKVCTQKNNNNNKKEYLLDTIIFTIFSRYNLYGYICKIYLYI